MNSDDKSKRSIECSINSLLSSRAIKWLKANNIEASVESIINLGRNGKLQKCFDLKIKKEIIAAGKILSVNAVSDIQLLRPKLDKPSNHYEEIFKKRMAIWWKSIEDKNCLSVRIYDVAVKQGLKWPYSRRKETLSAYFNYTYDKLVNLKGFGHEKFNTLLCCIKTVAEDSKYPENYYNGRVEYEGEKLEHLLSEILSKKELNIIKRYYGIGVATVNSYEKIGNIYRLTRERIRQIKNKALDQLTTPKIEQYCKKHLEANSYLIWNALADEKGVINASNYSEKRLLSNLEGELRLAISIIYKDLKSYLMTEGDKDEIGWHKKRKNEVEVNKTITFLVSKAAYPYPIDGLAKILDSDPNAVRYAIISDPRFCIYQDYVSTRPNSANSKRAVNLHRLLIGQANRGLSGPYEICYQYNKCCENDSLSVRKLEMLLENHQHLFLRMGILGWVALHYNGSNNKDIVNDSPYVLNEKRYFELLPNYLGKPGIFSSILNDKKIYRISDILAIYNNLAGRQISKNEIFTLFIKSREFVQVAPEIYTSIRLFTAFEAREGITKLLNENDCAYYVMARYAGVCINYYPYWSVEMERLWCIWAEDHCYKSLFRSLLYIANPFNWPSAESEKDEWNYRKEQEQEYSLLGKCRYPIYSYTISLRRFLSVLIYFKIMGCANWIYANHILGWRVGNHHASTALALAIGFGAINSADHWQKMHEINTENIDYVIQTIFSELYKEGNLNWATIQGRRLVEQLGTGIAELDYLGWVSIDDYGSLINRLMNDTS